MQFRIAWLCSWLGVEIQFCSVAPIGECKRQFPSGCFLVEHSTFATVQACAVAHFASGFERAEEPQVDYASGAHTLTQLIALVFESDCALHKDVIRPTHIKTSFGLYVDLCLCAFSLIVSSFVAIFSIFSQIFSCTCCIRTYAYWKLLNQLKVKLKTRLTLRYGLENFNSHS